MSSSRFELVIAPTSCRLDCANIRGGAEFRQKGAKLDSVMSDLRFRLLGPLEAERGGIALELGPRKQRAVLALLLLEANRVVSTERLIDELWGDATAGDARARRSQVYVAGLA
jgi:DNA-binding response OmpR family regulator